MRIPTDEEVKAYEDRIGLSKFFRDMDQTLAAHLTYEERVLVMTLVWPAAQNLAKEVVQRTISDMTSAQTKIAMMAGKMLKGRERPPRRVREAT